MKLKDKGLVCLFVLLCLLSNDVLRSQTTYSESFDASFRPPGWGGAAIVGTYDWTQYTTGAHTGAACAMFDSYDAAVGDYATLITPSFSLCASTAAHTVSFWMFRDSYTYTTDADYIQVYVNTSATLTGATSLGVVNRLYTSAPAVGVANTWYQYTYTIPAGFNGAANFVIFQAVSDYGNSMYIDDVSWVSDPCPTGPANDFCSGAIPVTCGNTYVGSTATATTINDPTAFCGTTPGAAGVFYSFAGNGQYVTASLCGSSYNTKINIYSGTCGSLACIDGNDDACGLQSDIAFPTGVGTTYYILVNGSGAATGNYSLNISCTAPGVVNDDCAAATTLTPNAGCVVTSGNTTGATPYITGCVGNADDDVWYKFTATATSHEILVTPTIGTFDPVVELLSGNCASLTSMVCQDVNSAGLPETIDIYSLTIGTTYYVRVYHFGAGSGGGTFNICVSNPPATPANDNCAGATSLTENVACVNTAGTTAGATSSGGTCSGSGSQDVWYSFVASNSTATITLSPSATMDAVIQLYSGACGSLTSIQCEDAGGTGVAETINAIGLVSGATYYVQVSDYMGSTQSFNICVYGPAAAGVPSNDAPCNAIAFPAVTTACNFETFTTVGATQEAVVAGQPPVPASCLGGSGASGGYSTHAGCNGDVWFSFVAPATGQTTITAQPGISPGAITNQDASMALYSGTCGNLTQIACSSDNDGSFLPATIYPTPPANNVYMPFIENSALTPGNTYYIRYWSFGCGNGKFGLCLQTTTNDLCANAINICDINNGYSSSTSSAYTQDWPSNMLANNEQPVTHASNGGANSGGVFGSVDAAGDANLPATEGVSLFDVRIDNNSWVRFTAASTKVTLTVTVGTCFKSPAKGIQMQMFSTNPTGGCTNFAVAAPFYQSTSGFTMSANNLVVGNSYIIMIDGFAGDVCNYTINPGSGVAFPDIVVSATPVCVGNSATLTAPAGATSYSWSTVPTQSTQAITVTPGTNITYTCVVTGSCGEKQTLTAPVSVSSSCAPLPITLISFDAIYKGGENAYVFWETATETNNNFFTVERSNNASDFKQIGATVKSKAEGGNSTSPLKYSLTDPDVSLGTYYYRLKQTDLDGTSTYSGVAEIHIDNSDAQFGLKPNPTTDRSEVTFTAFENSTALMRVMDCRGAVVSETQIPVIQGKNIVYIHLDDEPAGIYIVTLVVNEKMYRAKLIKRGN
ncbi:MAG: T9SS type A sorting domain-containing protein [Bacteroidia bacterium]